MKPESTERIAKDANQFIPRVLLQGKIIVTTSDNNPVLGFNGSDFLNLEELRVGSNTEYDFYVQPPNENKLYKLPITTLQTANGRLDWCARVFLSKSIETFTVLGFDVFQNVSTGSATNQFTFYYTIYTTQITDEAIL